MKASKILLFILLTFISINVADAQWHVGHHHMSHHSIRKEHKKWRRAEKRKERTLKHHH